MKWRKRRSSVTWPPPELRNRLAKQIVSQIVNEPIAAGGGMTYVMRALDAMIGCVKNGLRRIVWKLSNQRERGENAPLRPMIYEPDILTSDLAVVFCGLNPARTAAADGHNFSHPSNRFWQVLHMSGFTAVRLEPRNEMRLLEYHCGLTAIVRRPTRRARDVAPKEFRRARHGFETRMRCLSPRAIAFLGKYGFLEMMGQRNVAWGRQELDFAGAMAWILPNPSGLNRSFTVDELARRYAELRAALNSTARTGTNNGPSASISESVS
jgi:TDG/mug DNA glycosylase family protein